MNPFKFYSEHVSGLPDYIIALKHEAPLNNLKNFNSYLKKTTAFLYYKDQLVNVI
jgi:hypothetical protein